MSVHRYVCSVLDEMRELDKTRRYDRLIGMVEEVQTLVNRMEAKLAENGETRWSLKMKLRKARAKIKRLKEENNSGGGKT